MSTIPTKPIGPIASDSNFSMLLYGEHKVGKSKLCSMIPGHFILGCSPKNLDHLTARYVYIEEFEEAIKILSSIEEGIISCDAVIIDELDALYQLCRLYYRNKLNIVKDTDKDTYALYRCTLDKFSMLLLSLRKLGKTIIVTLNEDIETYSTLNSELQRYGCRATKQLREILEGKFTVWARMSTEFNGSRSIQVEGNPGLKAGNGYENHFRFEGKRLKKFSLGNDPEECYNLFLAAFNNELKGDVVK